MTSADCRHPVLLLLPSFDRLKTSRPLLLSSADGPDKPQLEVRPAQPFHIAGGSLSLSCQAEGLPKPTPEWSVDGEKLPGSSAGVLNLTDVQTSQGGMYTCRVINPETKKEHQESIDVNIYGEYVAVSAPRWLLSNLRPEWMSQHVKTAVICFEVKLF